MIEYTVRVFDDGLTEWRLNKQLHREDGPAVIFSNGRKDYYLNGKRHREDGPAVIYPDNYEEYWVNGKKHREDGPAIIYPDGGEAYYWINDKPLTQETFLNKTKKHNIIVDGKKIKISHTSYEELKDSLK